MSAEVKTFPKQDTWELETPFGTAKVNDWRGPDEHENINAGLYFEDLKINNKPYKGLSVYMKTKATPRGSEPQCWWSFSPSYSYALTDAARQKLTAYLDEQDKLKQYLLPLPWQDVERLGLERLRKTLAREIATAGEANNSTDNQVDDVLREMLNARNEGKSYMDLWLRPGRKS